MTRLKALLAFIMPADVGAWGTFAFGLLALVLAARFGHGWHWLEAPRRGGPTRARFLMSVAFAAAFLSLAYVAHYLGGGPRIIDATSYFLEGRTLAQGGFTFDVPTPTAAFRGRFLLFSEPSQLGGIFPPGYPLLLAFGFIIGAPMVIGPFLAAGLAASTYFLARELGIAAFGEAEERDVERAARGAALFSVVTAALRYHTADTMSHGAAALAVTLGLAALLLVRRTGNRPALSLLGLALGGLVATRPVSALPLLVATALHLAGRPPEGTKRSRLRAALRVAVFMAPGVWLLLASQAAVTGSWLGSTQKAYYAASDGPRDCFRYGFGAGIGCLFEHGDFVRTRLTGGFGPLAALLTTLRRLKIHLLDVTNFELFTATLMALSWPLVRRVAAARTAALVVLGQILAYAPFYFDGSYPGGGARFYADVIPVEHALFAVALTKTFLDSGRAIAVTLAASVLAFSLRASHDHVQLMKRDGGRPMFEPDLVREAHKDHGLIFFDTDHGFNLAHAPGVSASHGMMSVRLRGDDRDRYLYDSLGRPSTHRYVFGPEKSSLELFTPPSSGVGVFRYESEAEWPPLHQRGGYAEPAWASGIASGDRYLRLTPDDPSAPAEAELELLIPQDGRYTIDGAAVLQGQGAVAKLRVFSKGTEVGALEWSDPKAALPKAIVYELGARSVDLVAPGRLKLEVRGAPAGLDRVTLRKAP
ncbi:MAG: hypothetical protein IPG50_18770 [Myxococcales bacterium]|nr:hypothetical protein [Myxococcales bacterium]